MREIKFRAWDKEEKLMYKTFNMISEFKEMNFDKKFWETADDYILMQFTGLKDKNGKEIYEGDILKTIILKSFGKNDIWYFVTYLVEIEKDYNYGYKFSWKRLKKDKILTKTKEDYNKFKENFEKFGRGEVIIGNKFENPELLK